jgi:hypothetical protein
MTVAVPLDLAEQLALERATERVLDPHGPGDWTVSLVPFHLVPGAMLEVAVGPECIARRLLDTMSVAEVERTLRDVVRRREAATEQAP